MTNIKVFVKKRPVLCYYILAFIISYSALLFLMMVGGIPTTKQQMSSLLLVAISFMLLGPVVSGLLMTGLVDGRAGFRDLGSRLLRWRVGAGWYVMALCLAPLVIMGVLLGLSLFTPVYLPGIFTTSDKVSRLIMNLTAAVVTGICEEVGWTGFVTPKLEQRYGNLKTGLIIGVLWGIWHILPMAVLPSLAYSAPVSPGLYIALRTLSFVVGSLVAFRVLMLWVYSHTHSLLVLILMHISLTGSNVLFEPEQLVGYSNFVYDFVAIAAMWTVVAITAAASRGDAGHDGVSLLRRIEKNTP